ESVRDGDRAPVAHRVAPDALDAGVLAVVRDELERLGPGRLAVVTPTARADALRTALTTGLPDGTVGSGRATLDSPVSVLPVGAAKGLEFDVVVVVEPAEILAGSARGAHDLYVALTRPTQHLLVLHTGDLPPGLESLAVLAVDA
ncbi:MAG TPA: ATP-binding domain-containing protein, partial [Candidatus Nanopelagicales bacterium]|nr:ATP-binding domain-containing protein [Candidatus Nanopelagicales bacterium]